METRKRTYPRWLVYGLAVFAVGMAIFAAVASREHHSTETARNEAQSRLVALEAGDLRASDPSLAMQLALVAYRLSETTQARSALVEATAGEMPTRLLGPSGPAQIALGDDGHRLAIAYGASDQLKLYSLRYSQLRLLATMAAGRGSAKIDAVAISRSGRLLASGDSGGLVTLWSLATPARPKRLATLSLGSGAVYGLSFSPRGAALAAADANGSVQRWSLSSPGHLVGSPQHPVTEPELVAPGRPALHAVSYSRNGDTIAAVGRDGALVIWHAHAGTTPLATLTAGTRLLTAVTYSPDGRTLASAGEDGLIHLLKLNRHGGPALAETPLTGAGGVTALAFSRDGRYLAAGASGDALRIWSTSGWHKIASLPNPAAVTGAAFTDGDRHLLSSDAAGTTRIWQFPPPSSDTTNVAVRALAFSPDTPQLEVTGGKTRRTTVQWDVAEEWRPAPAGAWYAAPASAATSSVYTNTSTTRTGTPTTSGTSTSDTSATSTSDTTTTSTSGTTTTAVQPPGRQAGAAPDPGGHQGHRLGAEPQRRAARGGRRGSPGLAVERDRPQPAEAARQAGRLQTLGVHGRLLQQRPDPLRRERRSHGADLEPQRAQRSAGAQEQPADRAAQHDRATRAQSGQPDTGGAHSGRAGLDVGGRRSVEGGPDWNPHGRDRARSRGRTAGRDRLQSDRQHTRRGR